MMTYRSCPHCRKAQPVEAQFCSNCGAALPAAPDRAHAGAGSARGMLLLGIAVGVGVMGLLSLVLSGRETPTHTEQAEEVIYDSAQAAPAARWQDNVLMADLAQGKTVNEKYGSSVLGSDLTRTQVCSVTVLDSLEACPEDAGCLRKRGRLRHGLDGESGDLFDLYLAGECGSCRSCRLLRAVCLL